MKISRLIILIAVLVLLAVFLWAASKTGAVIEISSFSTKVSGRTLYQAENLRLALSKIDGTLLKPNEVFSFNTIVGERLRQWGYKGAPTIYHGQIIDTPGGGICQLSSTIYGAALYSGMEIIERKPHLYTISSVAPGFDAAILYDKIDLKFKNTLPHMVLIKGEMTDNLLTIKFFAPKEPDYRISIDVQQLQVYKALDAPLERDLQRIPSQGIDGVKVKVIRTISYDNKDIPEKIELVSIDTYKPVPGGRAVEE